MNNIHVVQHHVDGIRWTEIEEAARAASPKGRFIVVSRERISDVAIRAGGDDFIMTFDTSPERGRIFGSIGAGVASIEDRDGLPHVCIRTMDGTYAGHVGGSDIMENLKSLTLTGEYDDVYADLRKWHVDAMGQLLARQRLARSTALAMPSIANAVQQGSTAGRLAASRAELMASRLKVERSAPVEKAGKRVDGIVVDVVTRTKGGKLKIRTDDGYFPAFKELPADQLPLAVAEALQRSIGSPRGCQAVYATIGLLHRHGGAELEDGERVSKRFRCEVMRIMGTDPSDASSTFRSLIEEATGFVVNARMSVRPSRGRGRKIDVPIAVTYGFESGTDTRAFVKINEELFPDMENGTKRFLVPEAVLQIEEDRDGFMSQLALRLCFRLGMGTTGTERLTSILHGAAVHEWWTREVAKRGEPAMLKRFSEALDQLRSLPWKGNGPVDVVGGTVLEGDSTGKAMLVYRDLPAWCHSSPKAGTSDMSRHDRHALT